MVFRFGLCVVAVLVSVGCGTQQYNAPSASVVKPDANSVTINKPFEQVWSHTIPQIGKSFFVINNIDKSSGILNISYNGDPQTYVDCGTFHSKVGSQEQDTPVAAAHAQWTGPSGGILPARYSQTVTLDGRMNIVFERLSDTQTKVTVNSRYVITYNVTKQVGNYPPVSNQETTAFNTAGEGHIGTRGTCQPNGKFEQDVLALVQS